VTENEGVVDLKESLGVLRQEYGVMNLLTEGGPRFFADLLRNGLVDDIFQTISPVLVGSSTECEGRYSLVEGQAFTPEDAPSFRLVSLRTGVSDPSHLFVHYRRG
jgi:riboflavin biosynthesis pyrimidine reductase